ncbi:DUF3558 domain-containing protein [Amycolatopsis rhizosphaerae]|uniref:DUF3558 domain-containing protein n=1 Tax=Amycolatopsis rhizosphaerae TaxID=2053003 RepID=A0A558B4X6_9PSEU|nr:DUF3558 family protein [Amycolatopsis rhizosphaerae]TVT31543.1 DUF3558 domain-containing protein [Amycolatopsis rhizosphaerae]
MSTSTRAIRFLAATSCVAVVLVGCSSTTSGTPMPLTSIAGPSTSGPDTSSTSANVLANLNACQVLDQVLAGQGFNPGENKSRRNECGALKPGYGDFDLSLDPVQGLAEFTRTDLDAIKIDINGRNAMQATEELGGGCSVAMEVSAHARAVVGVTMSSPSQDSLACSNARQLAQRVEPLLPKGQ